jgi:membrane fusion protein, multidrug efflux system
MVYRNTALSLFALLGLTIAGCGGSGTAAQEDAPSNPGRPAGERAEPLVIPVEAEPPARGEISAYLDLVSKVEADRRVEVTAKGSGQVLSVHAEEGDRISAGAVLAELDKSEAEAQLRQTEVQLRQHRADYQRTRESYEYGIASQAELDNARFAMESTEANLRAQQIQVENLTVRAPLAGVVTARHVKMGELLSTGTPAFTIVDPDSYYVAVDVDERQVPNLRVGQQAEVRIRSLPGERFSATVRRINPSVDPQFGTVRVVLDFDRAARERLRDSAHAEVRLVMETRDDALLVPKVAVLERNARKFVFAVEPDVPVDAADPEFGGEQTAPIHIARRYEIVTGLEDAEYIEVLEGLPDDVLIVTLGQHSLEPNSRVRITSAAEELRERADIGTEEALNRAREEREAARQQPARGQR